MIFQIEKSNMDSSVKGPTKNLYILYADVVLIMKVSGWALNFQNPKPKSSTSVSEISNNSFTPKREIFTIIEYMPLTTE